MFIFPSESVHNPSRSSGNGYLCVTMADFLSGLSCAHILCYNQAIAIKALNGFSPRVMCSLQSSWDSEYMICVLHIFGVSTKFQVLYAVIIFNSVDVVYFLAV